MTENFDKLKAQKKRIETRAAGAVIERAHVKSYATRRLKRYTDPDDRYEQGCRDEIETLIVWLNEQPKRTKRKGGDWEMTKQKALAKLSTPIARRTYESSLRKWQRRFKALTNRVRESQRITGDDLKIVVR